MKLFTESCRNGDLWGSWTGCYCWIWTNGSGIKIQELLCSGVIIFSQDRDLLYLVLISYLQVLANFLSTPLTSGLDTDMVGWPYVAFDLNLSVVKVRKSCPKFNYSDKFSRWSNAFWNFLFGFLVWSIWCLGLELLFCGLLQFLSLQSFKPL